MPVADLHIYFVEEAEMRSELILIAIASVLWTGISCNCSMFMASIRIHHSIPHG